jgi:hypothetical protein
VPLRVTQESDDDILDALVWRPTFGNTLVSYCGSSLVPLIVTAVLTDMCHRREFATLETWTHKELMKYIMHSYGILKLGHFCECTPSYGHDITDC